jgi:hypothetical protein
VTHQRFSFREFGFTLSFAATLFVAPMAFAQDAQTQAQSVTAPAPADAGAQEKTIGPWHAIFSTDDKGQSVTELRLAATRPYTDDKSKEFFPDLVLVCWQHNTVAFIDMKKAIGAPDDETTRLQYGSKGGFPTRTEWNLSRDRVKVLVPDALDFVAQIRDKASLDFQITPFEAPPIAVFFTLDSIEQAFELMGERCYQ